MKYLIEHKKLFDFDEEDWIQLQIFNPATHYCESHTLVNGHVVDYPGYKLTKHEQEIFNYMLENNLLTYDDVRNTYKII